MARAQKSPTIQPVLTPPPTLNEDGLTVWKAYQPLIDSAQIKPTDYPSLFLACTSYQDGAAFQREIDDAVDQIRTLNEIADDEETELQERISAMKQSSGLVRIKLQLYDRKQKALNLFAMYSSKLGATPVDRGKLKAKEEKPKKNRFDALASKVEAAKK